MPKSISIYIPDLLVEKMDTLPEVNWSEICRVAIEDYVTGRRRYDTLGEEMKKRLDSVDLLEARLRRLIEYEQEVRENDTSPTMFAPGGEEINCPGTTLTYCIKESRLDLVIELENDYDWDVVLDRITFDLQITSRKNGMLIHKKGSFVEKFLLSSNTGGYGATILLDINCNEINILKEIAKIEKSERERDYYYNITMKIFCDSRKGVLRTLDFISGDIYIYESMKARYS